MPCFNRPGRDGAYRVEPEKHRLSEFVVVGQEILPSGLRADIKAQRVDPVLVLSVLANAEVYDVDAALFLHGAERIKKDLRIQRVEQIVMFVAEMLGGFGLPVKQIGSDHAERSLFREEGCRILPGRKIDLILRKAEVQKPALFLLPENPDLRIFLQLFAYRGFIDHKGVVGMRETVRHPVGDLADASRRTVDKKIQDAEMQHDILVRKAFRFPGIVQRIERHASVVHGDEDVLALGGMPEGHVAAKPALNAAPLVVIAACTFLRVIFTAFESVYIEIPHVVADLFKVLDQLAVGHVLTSFEFFSVVF